MPKTKLQQVIYAALTVMVTVHAYVFYSLYVVNGAMLMQVNHAQSVLAAILAQNGVYMFGTYLPIWAVIVIEFVCAFALELTLGAPCAMKMARKRFDPDQTSPAAFETAIICATVTIMCPAMSFLAACMYYPYTLGFHIFMLLANWIKLVCFNFPFAFFTQIFFIQPLIRLLFSTLFSGRLCHNRGQTAPTEQTITWDGCIGKDQ